MPGRRFPSSIRPPGKYSRRKSSSPCSELPATPTLKPLSPKLPRLDRLARPRPEFFEGVPQLVIPDNLKSGVIRADRYEPTLNRSYQEMLAHYSTTALPSRPKKPRDKAKVEVAVQLVERWILARLRKQTFFSITEVNQRIRGLLARLNQRPFRKLAGSRRSQYETLDRPAFTTGAEPAYEFAEWKHGRAHVDYHVEVHGHYYSVPHSLRARQVEVRISAPTVEFFITISASPRTLVVKGRRSYDGPRTHAFASSRAKRMESPTFSQLGGRHRSTHANSCAACWSHAGIQSSLIALASACSRTPTLHAAAS